MRSLLGCPLLALVLGCADGGSAAPDAAVDAAIDAPPPVDAQRMITLNQTDSQVVTPQASVACNQMGPPQVSRENSYYRVFELHGWTLDRPFTPLRVDFGVEQATAMVGSQMIEVKLHTLVGPLQLANLTTISTISATLANSGITMVMVPIDPAPVVAPGSTLVVEVHQPDGTAGTSTFFIGANKQGESAPGYLRAPDCGIAEPTSYADLGFTATRLVLTVTGTY